MTTCVTNFLRKSTVDHQTSFLIYFGEAHNTKFGNSVVQTHIGPGTKVLYLGAASGTTVSHASDIVGKVSDTTLQLSFLPSSGHTCDDGWVSETEQGLRLSQLLYTMSYIQRIVQCGCKTNKIK